MPFTSLLQQAKSCAPSWTGHAARQTLVAHSAGGADAAVKQAAHFESRLFIAGMATPSPMPMAARASSSTGSETRAAMGVSTVARLHHTCKGEGRAVQRAQRAWHTARFRVPGASRLPKQYRQSSHMHATCFNTGSWAHHAGAQHALAAKAVSPDAAGHLAGSGGGAQQGRMRGLQPMLCPGCRAVAAGVAVPAAHECAPPRRFAWL